MAKPDVLLSFISMYWMTVGKSPSLAKMAKGVGMSKSGVYDRVKKLVAAGLLEYDPANRSYLVIYKGE